MRRAAPSWGAVLGLALLLGCGDETPPGAAENAGPDVPSQNFPLTLVDDEGSRVTLEAPPDRIVSLVPSATRVLVALELTGRLVARTDFDREPGLEHLPSVGGGLEPSAERLIAVEPDLVIRFGGESDRATPGHLDRAGIPHLAVRPLRIEDVRRMVRTMGRATDRVAASDSLLDTMDRELAELAEAMEGASRPRVAFLLGGDPPWVVGPGTFLHELVELAGGRNAFEDQRRDYAPMSVEEVLARDVDLILALPGARVPPVLGSIPVRRVPEELQRPDHRIAASARTLARILHPDRLP